MLQTCVHRQAHHTSAHCRGAFLRSFSQVLIRKWVKICLSTSTFCSSCFSAYDGRFPLCCGQTEMQWHGGLICGCGRRCLTQLLEVSSLLQSLVCAPMLGFCSRQFLASGNPTKQSYSQATHLVFFKENRTKHLYKVFFLSSYFTVSAALCLTGAPPCIPPSCQLQPSFPLLAVAPRPGRKNQGWGNMGNQIPLLTMLRVRTMDNNSHCCWQVWEVISNVTHVQVWAPGMDEETWEPRMLQWGWSLWPPIIFWSQCVDNFLGCIRSLGLNSSHPLLENTCTYLGGYHSYLISTRKWNTCCCCFSMDWRGCWWHPACLVCREWVLPWW